MAGCSQRPRCHKTKSRRCIKPNPWLSYLTHHGGKGLSRIELMSGYKKWKHVTFRRFTSSSKAHVARRQDKLCDMFAPGSKPGKQRNIASRALPRARQPQTQARSSPAANKLLLTRERERKDRQARLAVREKERAAKGRELAAERRRRASMERKKAASDSRRSKERKALAKLREAAKARNEGRLRRRVDRERRASANKAKKTGNQNATRDGRDVELLRQKFCKVFRSSAASKLKAISDTATPLLDSINRYGETMFKGKYSALSAYHIDVPDNGTCMWAAIAGGLFGSSAQWKSISFNGETLCDKMVLLYKEFSEQVKRHGTDYKFIKWIFMRQLHAMSEVDRRVALDMFNTDERAIAANAPKQLRSSGRHKGKTTKASVISKAELVDTANGTSVQAYKKLMEMYKTAISRAGYWGSEEELSGLRAALSPFVDIVVFEQRVRTIGRGDEESIDEETRVIMRAHRNPKCASVLFLSRDIDHYNLLTLRHKKEDFLVLQSQVPEYVYTLVY